MLGALPLCGVCAAANVDYFADNGYGNPVSTMHHPAAEHFINCPNLLLTPHIAGVSAESNERVSFLIADKVLAALA